MSTENTQLSLEVKPHRELREAGEDGILIGTLRGAFECSVDRNYDAGDALFVHVYDADGVEVGRAAIEVQHVTPVPIRERNVGVIGTERRHKAK